MGWVPFGGLYCVMHKTRERAYLGHEDHALRCLEITEYTINMNAEKRHKWLGKTMRLYPIGIQALSYFA